jgi:hypothetical protein
MTRGAGWMVRDRGGHWRDKDRNSLRGGTGEDRLHPWTNFWRWSGQQGRRYSQVVRLERGLTVHYQVSLGSVGLHLRVNLALTRWSINQNPSHTSTEPGLVDEEETKRRDVVLANNHIEQT